MKRKITSKSYNRIYSTRVFKIVIFTVVFTRGSENSALMDIFLKATKAHLKILILSKPY